MLDEIDFCGRLYPTNGHIVLCGFELALIRHGYSEEEARTLITSLAGSTDPVSWIRDWNFDHQVHRYLPRARSCSSAAEWEALATQEADLRLWLLKAFVPLIENARGRRSVSLASLGRGRLSTNPEETFYRG